MKILIIHTAFIGDIVLSTPLVALIKKIYPESEIHYLTTPQGESILRNNSKISNIIPYDKKNKDKGLKGIMRMYKFFKKEKYDIVVTPHRYLRSSILSFVSRAKIRKGYSNATLSLLYTEKIPYVYGIHEIERLNNFFKIEKERMEEVEKIKFESKIELYPSKEEKTSVDTLLGNYNERKLLVIAPGSKWFTKKWPGTYFNEVIQALQKEKKLKLAIVGGNEEREINLEFSEDVLDLRGKTNLLELSEILGRSVGVLTNDSSPIHIGSVHDNCFIFALFGPTVEKFGFFPWSKKSYVFQKELECRPCGNHGGNKCPKGHFKCMLEIKPEDVIIKIKEELRINSKSIME